MMNVTSEVGPGACFDLSLLEKWSDDVEFKVYADRLIAYAEATNDADGRHARGELAAPLFAVVPVLETNVLGPALTRTVPQEFAMQVLHGEHDILMYQPIKPGEVLQIRGAPIGVHVKRSGTAVVLKSQTRNRQDLVVNEQYMTLFYRGATDGPGGGDTAPDHRFPDHIRTTDPLDRVVKHIDDDQTYRYAEASGDHMPVHLDTKVAKSVGLPGIIVHGLCTMALTSQAVVNTVCNGDSERLKRLAVRFANVVLPGEDVTTTIWRAGSRESSKLCVFETTDSNGTVVVKDGLAEVAG